MSDNNYYGDKEVQKILKQIPKEVKDLDTGRAFLAEKLPHLRTFIKKFGKHGGYLAIAGTHLESRGDDLQGVIRRLILAA